MTGSGRAWCFGDDVDTDAIISATHLSHSDPAYWAAHALEVLRPEFAQNVKQGDVLLAGHSFGSGSSREHAAIALRECGLTAVVAKSFARNFYRNAWNNGLPALEAPDILGLAADGDLLDVDLARGLIRNARTGQELTSRPVPPFLLDMAARGGLIPWLKANSGWKLGDEAAT